MELSRYKIPRSIHHIYTIYCYLIPQWIPVFGLWLPRNINHFDSQYLLTFTIIYGFRSLVEVVMKFTQISNTSIQQKSQIPRRPSQVQPIFTRHAPPLRRPWRFFATPIALPTAHSSSLLPVVHWWNMVLNGLSGLSFNFDRLGTDLKLVKMSVH